MQQIVKRIIFFAALLGVWEAIVKLLGIKPVVFPAPSNIFQALWKGFADLTLVYDLLASFERLIIGLAIALLLGTLLGVILAGSKTIDDTVGSLILALQSVPSIVWLPLAIIWFGLNEKAIIFIVVLGGTLVMTLNMRTGIKSVPPIYIKAARTMDYNGFSLFAKVIFPAAIPHAVTGARLAWAFAWRGLMGSELLSTGPGLGYTLKFASDFGDMSLVIGIIFIIALIGIFVDLVFFSRIEKKVLKKWGLQEQ
ncbi:ABC transporter permease [Aeribacillus composti]|uniref:ABC transporter permease n=1 Tax=Aeribacillus composti TaxID=1868734 RepID=UPI002E1C5358|nr:ABC transporter permease [Aeribacillus composti]